MPRNQEAAAGNLPRHALLFSRSEEHGQFEGLDILPGSVVRFTGGDYKVPHMGWNSLQFEKREHPLFAGLEEGHVYFVHSYHVLPEVQADLLAVTDYGQPVTAIVGAVRCTACSSIPRRAGSLG